MKKDSIAGIKRSSQFSPNHIGNDAAIFNLTLLSLKKRGYQVCEYTEQEFIETEIEERVIFNMSRDALAVAKLKSEEANGKVVVNSGIGIENCTREKMTRLLLDHHVPHPESLIVDTDVNIKPILGEMRFNNCWIKRGDFHAIHKEDVSYVRHVDEAQGILEEYALRGIRRAVINRHLEGDLIKFYGVSGSDFFYWFYPFDLNHSKFGFEQINGKASGISFSVEELQAICQDAADVLNVRIYGGDCIVSPDGEIRIIDFNDWPSFAPCRESAAPHIADCIEREIKKQVSHITCVV